MLKYFGYGSNINLVSLKAKGVVPYASELAILKGWRLVFNVQHWFRHEGGVGNVVPSANPEDYVEGIIHDLNDDHLAALDIVEAYGVGYDRTMVDLETKNGSERALTYIGLHGYLNDDCLPTRRYLNIILKGAREAGLSNGYIENLEKHALFIPKDYPEFVHPEESSDIFNEKTLVDYPHFTALGGAVFDMRGARQDLECLNGFFGGKDMTLFHLKRLDTSDGTETLEDIKYGRISAYGKKYINAYLNEYMNEYEYAGRYVYD